VRVEADEHDGKRVPAARERLENLSHALDVADGDDPVMLSLVILLPRSQWLVP
jgi:hypothetical protein